MGVSTAIIIYLQQVWPLETPFATKLEIFNEVTITLLTYGLMTFTDYVPEPETRYTLGWHYLTVTCANIFVHLCLLVGNSGQTVRIWCRRKYLKH